MRSGYYGDFFKSDPYHMYARMDKRINDCLTKGYAIASVPDSWVELFTKNAFYWAGWAWGNPYRNDGMHHEFYGPCYKVKSYEVK